MRLARSRAPLCPFYVRAAPRRHPLCAPRLAAARTPYLQRNGITMRFYHTGAIALQTYTYSHYNDHSCTYSHRNDHFYTCPHCNNHPPPHTYHPYTPQSMRSTSHFLTHCYAPLFISHPTFSSTGMLHLNSPWWRNLINSATPAKSPNQLTIRPRRLASGQSDEPPIRGKESRVIARTSIARKKTPRPCA
jgi:hypothetical protein